MKTLTIFAVCSLTALAGCATVDSDRIEDMEYRLTRLEKKVIPEEAAAAAEQTTPSPALQATEETTTETTAVIPDSPTKKDIQQALKNAGYYDGTVDGKFGPQTKAAIEKFQDANNLVVDGKAGVNTWEKLRAFYTPTEEE